MQPELEPDTLEWDALAAPQLLHQKPISEEITFAVWGFKDAQRLRSTHARGRGTASRMENNGQWRSKSKVRRQASNLPQTSSPDPHEKQIVSQEILEMDEESLQKTGIES